MNRKRLVIILTGSILFIAAAVFFFKMVNRPEHDEVTSPIHLPEIETQANLTTHEGAHEESGCIVSFLDKDGALLETVPVEKGGYAIPPAAPLREDALFTGWSGSLTNILQSKSVSAVYKEMNNPAISIGNAYAALSDETVELDLYLWNNPGIASLMIDLQFPQALTLQQIDFSGEFGEYITAPEPYKSPQTISLVSPFEDILYSGRIATLTFQLNRTEILENQSSIDVLISYVEDNTFNTEFDDVTLMTINGSVTLLK